MELLTKLGINWQQLLAQAVNFVIIMSVLSYFVYKPVLRTIDARTARIKKAMDDAKEIENQKKELENFKQDQLRVIDKEVGLILEKAKQEADRMKKDIIDAAQKEADSLQEKGEKKLAEERSRVFGEVHDTLNAAIIGMTEKILKREFSEKDQERVLSYISEELPKMLVS